MEKPRFLYCSTSIHMRSLPLDSEVQGHSPDFLLRISSCWNCCHHIICSNGLMYIGFSLNILCTITPFRTWPGARVGFTKVLWTGMRISKSTPSGIFSSNASFRQASSTHSDHSFCNWKPEITWPFSINHTLFPCLGTLLISGPVSNITSLMKGPLTTFSFTAKWVVSRSDKLPSKVRHVSVRLEELELPEEPAWLSGLGLVFLVTSLPRIVESSYAFC